MICLTIPHSNTVQYVAPSAIARVIEASASSQWHGIRSTVKRSMVRLLSAVRQPRRLTMRLRLQEKT